MAFGIEWAAAAVVLTACLAAPVTNSKWQLISKYDLAVFEAFEHAVSRINDIRSNCGLGLRLAPLRQGQYMISESYRQEFDLFTEFLLHIVAKDHLAPIPIRIHVARRVGSADMSVFEVLDVDPPPCDLYCELDDAELMISPTSSTAEAASEVALKKINLARAAVCSHRPALKLVRVISAALQAVEGKLVRIVAEIRESVARARSFMETVLVHYAPDPNVASEASTFTYVYSSKTPCKLKYSDEEQSALSRRLLAHEWSIVNFSASSAPTSAPSRSTALLGDQGHAAFLNQAEAVKGGGDGRRLDSNGDVYSSHDDSVVRPFIDAGYQIPDHFDPRLERTLCFPRGISRRQGTCGSSWAFAATAVASFRECLLYLHTGDPSKGLHFFSAQELISCLDREGCSGGDAGSAFYYMKRRGIARESCSPYRMRCFVDNSVISASATDAETSQARSKFHDGSRTCPMTENPNTSPCNCLPQAFHVSRPQACSALPVACKKTMIHDYFRIAGSSEGNSAGQVERHMMQELITSGPLYVSFLVYEDLFDAAAWTDTAIYIHGRGELVGKHAAVAVGWGTDRMSRDYWLLLNSAGEQWQQEGYFKVARGDTSLELMTFGAWGVDASSSGEDRAQPHIFNVEVSFSLPDVGEQLPEAQASGPVWLQVVVHTDEKASAHVEVKGMLSGAVSKTRDDKLAFEHVLRIDVASVPLFGERAQILVWAVDAAGNTGQWGPLMFSIPTVNEFKKERVGSSVRRLGRPLLV
eukprot:TRINITY_DN11566_c0_g1_i1.p1 TRINITY_DN11566_c0_g1~~TRINITY_DN11566_c0_g1_i1.p1  ORF type:complete len:755 (+),score=95.72 TRINITY_DN11566_c0_g1_i1:94-2358(+)